MIAPVGSLTSDEWRDYFSLPPTSKYKELCAKIESLPNGAYEYIDRGNWNTVCLGTFEKLSTLPDKSLIGRRMIVHRWRDKDTMLPVIMTIIGTDGTHLSVEQGGSWAADLCFIETE